MPSGCCASTWSGATARRAQQHLRHRRRLHIHHLPRPGLYVPHLPETIGGRYWWAATWAFLMAVAGVDIRALVQGCGHAGYLLSPRRREPARYARFAGCWEHGYRLEMLSFSNPG
ncbi:MAG: hypothetical protein ACLT5P_06050 [Flavonifractor plautii]